MNPYTSSGSVATMTANVSGNDKLNDLGDGPRQPGDPERYPVGAVTRRLMGYVRPHRISFTASFVSAAISVISAGPVRPGRRSARKPVAPIAFSSSISPSALS